VANNCSNLLLSNWLARSPRGKKSDNLLQMPIYVAGLKSFDKPLEVNYGNRFNRKV
jgi:hypothetical protein